MLDLDTFIADCVDAVEKDPTHKSAAGLSEQCEPVSARAGSLSFTRSRDHATRRERRYGSA